MVDKTKFIAILALVLAIVAMFLPASSKEKMVASLGAAGGMLAENYIPYIMYNDGYKSEKNIELSGAGGDITTGDDLTVTDDATIIDDLTVSGGVLAVTTAANATSTLTIGEVETYATSSATKICLKFSTVSTSSTPVANDGFVLWSYGACP